MLAHYLTVTAAQFRKNPFTTLANILTLALGLACFIVAYGVTEYWRSADGYRDNTARTVVIAQRSVLRNGGGPSSPISLTSPAVARYVAQDFPELERIARASPGRDIPLVAGDNKRLVNVAYVDNAFLEMFHLDFIAGDPARALEPNGVVLTQEVAKQLFGDAPALGKVVRVNNSWDGTVTGVIAPVRQPSFMGSGRDSVLAFQVLTRWTSSPLNVNFDARDNWLYAYALTFVSLPPTMSIDAFNDRLTEFVRRRVPSEQSNAAEITLRAFPLRQLATYRLDSLLASQSGVQVSVVSLLLAVGLLTLGVACLNYANLATAQSAARTKEVGMRKVLGAGRLAVMAQSWLEALLSSTAAVIAALAVLALAAPVVRASFDVDFLHFLTGDGVARFGAIARLVALVLAVTCLASVYPALYLSRVRPIASLQSGRSPSAPKFVATILVGIQFASASFLLIFLVVAQLQRAHLESTALAPREDPILVLNDVVRYGVDYETIAARLRELPRVRSVSVVDKTFWGIGSFNIVQFSRSNDPGASAPSGFYKPIGYDYFETLNLRVLAGRVFDREHDPRPIDLFAKQGSNVPPIVIDQLYAERLGFKTPEAAVDAIIYVPASFTEAFGEAAQPVRVIGVTETEPMRVESGADGLAGTSYTYTPKASFGGQFPLVRISREDVRGTVTAITRVWEELAPYAPADFHFFDELFEMSYRQYARMSELFMLLAVSAFVITAIGQLGIAVHVATRRRQEIGVRKTLGSSTSAAVRKLLFDFSKPVLVANLLAWPFGYIAARVYLDGFADHMQLTLVPFLASLAITLAIAWLAVIGEVVKTARVGPAEALRYA